MTTKETGLAEAKPAEITQAKVGDYALNDVLERELWKSQELARVANITFPVTALDSLPPMHKPSLTIVTVNTERKSKDTYFITSDQLGLSKPVILKMLNAAGANVMTRKLTRDTDLEFIRWQALVWGRLPDGTPHQISASKAWNATKSREDFIRKAVEKNAKAKSEYKVSEQEARAKGLNAALQYREFADEQTESKAILRAARAFLNIQTSYSPEELQKPFLIAKSVPSLDTTDPEIKRMVAQELVKSSFALYGGAQGALPQPQFPDLTDVADDTEFDETDADFREEPIDSEASATTEAEPASDATDQGADEDEYNPFAETPEKSDADMQADAEAALDARLLALGKPNTQGGIGGRLAEIVKSHGLETLKGVSHDMKLVIVEEAEKARESRAA